MQPYENQDQAEEALQEADYLKAGTWAYRVDVEQPRGMARGKVEHTGSVAQDALNAALSRVNQEGGTLLNIVFVKDQTTEGVDSFLLIVNKE